MNPDFQDFLAALLNAGARFIVVGAHALAVHGVPRATGDLDIWIDRSEENTQLVWRALSEFGAPVDSLNISVDDLSKPNLVVQLGLPPRRIDLLTDVTGVTFTEAWEDRVVRSIGSTDVPFMGRATFIKNKRAVGRNRDLADLESLGEVI